MEYNSIKPLIEKEEVRRDSVTVTFTCSETGVSHTSSAAIEQKKSSQIMENAKKTAKRSLLRSAKRSLTRTISQALGHGVLGRVGRDIASSALNTAAGSHSSDSSVPDDIKEQAVTQAFEQVSSYFTYNKELGKWVGVQSELMPQFTTMIEKNPVKERYDNIILARMLTEIAVSDDEVTDEEKAFLENFLPEDMKSVDELINMKLLTRVEIQETSKSAARETMVLLCWGVAFSDEELSDDEKDMVNGFAEALEISEERNSELKEISALYIIDQMFTCALNAGSYEDAKDHAYEVASGLGFNEELIQRAEINFKKRNLLF